MCGSSTFSHPPDSAYLKENAPELQVLVVEHVKLCVPGSYVVRSLLCTKNLFLLCFGIGYLAFKVTEFVHTHS